MKEWNFWPEEGEKCILGTQFLDVGVSLFPSIVPAYKFVNKSGKSSTIAGGGDVKRKGSIKRNKYKYGGLTLENLT